MNSNTLVSPGPRFHLSSGSPCALSGFPLHALHTANALSREEASAVRRLTLFVPHLSEITVLHHLNPTSCKLSLYIFHVFVVVVVDPFRWRENLVPVSPSWPEAKYLTFIPYILSHRVNMCCVLVFFSKLKKKDIRMKRKVSEGITQPSGYL